MADEFTEVKTQFFTLIHDGRPEKKEAAAAFLRASQLANVRKLAEIGEALVAVRDGNTERAIFEMALEGFRSLPTSDFWYKFIETSGQVLISAGSIPGRDPVLARMLCERGLELMSFALTLGIPLSDQSVSLVRGVQVRQKSLSAMAGAVLSLNEQLGHRGGSRSLYFMSGESARGNVPAKSRERPAPKHMPR